MPKLQLQNVNMGGIADSNYLGSKNSVADMIGFDIHSEVGVLKVNNRLVKESGSTVDDFIKAMVACSDGSTYMFGSTGSKIWSRAFDATYALEATASPNSGIHGAIEYQGYIYYAFGTTRLGRWQLGTAWSTRTDNWATFNNSSTYRPMQILNAVLYIGDGNQVAQVDAGVFSANALDIDAKYTVSCLGQMGTDLLLGTVTSDGSYAQIFRWNTWSVSFTNSDPIIGNAIWAFLPMDNSVMVIGSKGQIYLYDGSTLEPYKRIKGTWTFSNDAQVFYNAVLNYNGLPLFGLSIGTGLTNAASEAIWSLGRANRNYPYVLNCEVGTSLAKLVNTRIGAMALPVITQGNGYLVSWWDTSNNTYGVDLLSATLKYSAANLTTRVIMPDRMQLVNFGIISAGWRTKPANTGFTFSTKKNNGTMTALSAGEHIDDTQRNVTYSKVDINEANTLQVNVAVTVSGTNAPELEVLEVDLGGNG